MNKAFNQVKEFHKACGIEMLDKPTMLSGAKEEIIESFANDLTMICKEMKHYQGVYGEVLARSSWMLEELIEFMQAKTIEDQADALTDLMYFIIGTFTLMGVKPEPIFNIVANANLGKIMPDGTVLRNEQGKIQKPEGWHEKFAPESKIRAEIEQQTRTAECPVCKGESKKVFGLECPECN